MAQAAASWNSGEDAGVISDHCAAGRKQNLSNAARLSCHAWLQACSIPIAATSGYAKHRPFPSDHKLSLGAIEWTKARRTADGPATGCWSSTDATRALVELFPQALSGRISMVLAGSTPRRVCDG
jgi:hypothetical protein